MKQQGPVSPGTTAFGHMIDMIRIVSRVACVSRPGHAISDVLPGWFSGLPRA